ncbi:MAG: hypothetical protein WCE68_15225 [Anaerolineales bacterium]
MSGLAALLFLGASGNPVAAQQPASTTPNASQAGQPFITVTYIEPINVRTGPSSFDYPVVGTIPVGGTAVAVGRSPAGEWIEIVYPAAPRGTGWVYAANVTLSPPGFMLQIVEPPPTPAPLETATLNPTFVAAFPILPTSTRMPTFTAPPPLAIPTYTYPVEDSSGRVTTTWVVIAMGLIGVAGIIVSSLRRR